MVDLRFVDYDQASVCRIDGFPERIPFARSVNLRRWSRALAIGERCFGSPRPARSVQISSVQPLPT